MIILPDAPVERGRRLREIIGSESWKRLVNWISFGGTLVLCGESIAAIPQTEVEPIAHFAIRRELLEQIQQLERQVANDLYSNFTISPELSIREFPSFRRRRMPSVIVRIQIFYYCVGIVVANDMSGSVFDLVGRVLDSNRQI